MIASLVTYNLRYSIWNKVKKPSKTGQNWKTLLSAFAEFLTTIARALTQIKKSSKI